MLDTAGEVKTDSLATFSNGLLHIDTPILADKHELTFISFVQTLDAIKKTYKEWWPIGMNDERESRESMLLACIEDNEELLFNLFIYDIFNMVFQPMSEKCVHQNIVLKATKVIDILRKWPNKVERLCKILEKL